MRLVAPDGDRSARRSRRRETHGRRPRRRPAARHARAELARDLGRRASGRRRVDVLDRRAERATGRRGEGVPIGGVRAAMGGEGRRSMSGSSSASAAHSFAPGSPRRGSDAQPWLWRSSAGLGSGAWPRSACRGSMRSIFRCSRLTQKLAGKPASRPPMGAPRSSPSRVVCRSFVRGETSPRAPGAWRWRPARASGLRSRSAATPARRAAVARPSVLFLHGVCVAFWIGALLPLALGLRDVAERASLSVGANSRASPMRSCRWLVLLALSGLWLAFVQLDRLDALWTTGYGQVLACKLAAVAVLVALAAANRYRLVPRFERDGAAAARLLAIRRVRARHRVDDSRTGGALALYAAATRARRHAPISLPLHGERPWRRSKSSAGQAAKPAASVLVLDGAFQPLAAKEVTLVLANPAAGIEPIRINATRAGASGQTSAATSDWRSATCAFRSPDAGPAGRNPDQRFREADRRGHRHAAAAAVEQIAKSRRLFGQDHASDKFSARMPSSVKAISLLARAALASA